MKREEAIATLWQAGQINKLVGLHEVQNRIREQYYQSDEHVFVLCCARRLGKSFLLTSLALEACRRFQNNQVFYIAETQKQVRQYLLPMVRQQLQSCPNALQPKFRATDNAFFFPESNMTLTILGADKGRLETARGNKAILIIVDEAAFIDNLAYAVKSILGPMTKGPYGAWRGRILMASTPPVSPSHDFAEFCQKADSRGVLCHYTIHDNPLFTPRDIQEAKDECGGESSTDYRREYLAEFVTDETRAVVPEFTREKQAQLCITDMALPAYAKSCTAVDLGFHDLSFGVFTSYDFLAGKVVVPRAFVCKQSNSSEIARQVAALEDGLIRGHHYRVIDSTAFTTNDFNVQHQLEFNTLHKDDMHAALAHLRLLLSQGRVLFNMDDDGVRQLVKHLEYAVWNKSKTSFERSEAYGHYDGVAALMYALRHLDMQTNPYPRTLDGVSFETHHIPKNMMVDNVRDLGDAFSLRAYKKRRRRV